MLQADKIIRSAEKILLDISLVAAFAIMLVTTFDVLSRAFGLHVPALFEFTADYLMVMLVFLPMSYVFITGANIKVELFIRYIPTNIYSWLLKFFTLSALVYYYLIFQFGLERAMQAFRLSEVSYSVLEYPMGPAYIVVPIGVGVLVIRMIQSLIFPRSIQPVDDNTEEINLD